MKLKIFLILIAIVDFTFASDLNVEFDDFKKFGSPGDFIQFHNKIINNSSNSIKVLLVKKINYKPAGWICSFCIGNQCYSPMVDTIEFTLPANKSVDLYLDVTTDSVKDTSSVSITIVNLNKTEETFQRDFIISTKAATGINEVTNNNIVIKVMPNPFKLNLKIESSVIMKNIKIFDIMGRLLYKINLDRTSLFLGEREVYNIFKSSGTYLLYIDTPYKDYFKKVQFIK